MNKVILMGRLTRDPEVKTTQSSKQVVRLTLAVDRPGAKKNGDTQTADFISVVAWEKSAEVIGKYLSKGSQILVEGRLTVRQYEADGQKRSVTEVMLERFEFAGGNQSHQGIKPNSQVNTAFGGAEEEDVPF